MEEILASIKRIIEDSDGVRRAGPDSAPSDTLEVPSAANDADAGEVSAFSDEIGGLAKLAAPVGEAFGPYVAPAAAPFRSEPAEVAPARPQAPAPARAEAPAAAPKTREPSSVIAPFKPTPAPEPQAARSTILSDKAGRQVAAAFGELSDAFAASRKRSFDEIAEEMMRPMLQDWLDNNLPMLVERLVREEIERVARGAAR